jgi:hypothetical protein
MQLGKKSKTTDMFEKVRGEFGGDAEEDRPLIASPVTPAVEKAPAARMSSSYNRDPIHVTIGESITAKLSREGVLESFSVKGELNLRISDSAMTKIKLNLEADTSSGAQFRTHPRVDKAVFTKSQVIQLKDTSTGFPENSGVGVLKWTNTAKEGDSSVVPITFTVWVNRGSGSTYNITVEYELTGDDSLKDVTVSIPFSTSEPSVSSYDATYEVSGDSLEWSIGTVDEENQSGSFEFEATADDDSEFFPMSISFSKSKPFVGVDVSVATVFEISTNKIGFERGSDSRRRGSDILKGDQVGSRFVPDRIAKSQPLNANFETLCD